MKLLCPECGEWMSECGLVEETLLGFYSPPGHDHDDNCRIRIYYCQNGHHKKVSIRQRCPVCDWIGKELCWCHPNKKVDEWPEFLKERGL